MRILFTSAGRRVELIEAFREAARRLGIPLVIHGSDISMTAPALFYCDIKHLTRRISDPGYIPQLLEICRNEQIDLLIPTIDTDLLILAKTREQFEALGTKVLISAPDKIAVCRDKRITAEFFAGIGLKSPRPVDDIEAYDGGFPCFIKPRDGSSSFNAFRVETRKELETYVMEVPEYIIQPYIRGTEYTIDTFCDFEGNPIFLTPRERVLVRQGEVIKTTITQDPRMIEEAKKICKAFRPVGPMAVQLIRQEQTGEDWFIEINPRFGGGSPLSMKAGADGAEAALRIALGESVPYQEKAAKDGREYSRYDDSIVSGGNDIIEISALSEVKSHLEGLSAVIFDLDDTLYPEMDYVRSGWKKTAALGEKIFPGTKKEALCSEMEDAFYKKMPVFDTLADLHAAPENREEAVKALLSVYRNQEPDLKLGEEAQELISFLYEKNIRIGILTDGRPEGQRAKLRALGLLEDERICEILITDELAGKSGKPETFRKPNSIGFRLMQQRLSLPFEKVAYVGDNIAKDFTAPGRLGMRCFWYRSPEGLYRKDKT